MKLPILVNALQRSWDSDTSYYKDWTPSNPSYGQCAVTALVAQDYLGGDIISCYCLGYRHYYNEINKWMVDLTQSQYAPLEPYYTEEKVVTRGQLLKSKQTKLRYEILCGRVENVLTGVK